MAIYEYRCERDGAFDLVAPMGTAPSTASCPACAGESARVFSGPMISRAPRALVAALDHEQKTRYEPDVVTSLPRAGHRKPAPMARMTPQLAKLPRP
jgi:putative FmdB family regulatory protein